MAKSFFLKPRQLREKQKKQLAQGKKTYSQEEALRFLQHAFLYTAMLPYLFLVVSEQDTVDPAIIKKSKKLRSQALYPLILKKIVEPLARDRLRKLGVADPRALSNITLEELGKENTKLLAARAEEIRQGKTFVYEHCEGKESVTWVRNPRAIVAALEGGRQFQGGILRGVVAYPGIVRGIARVVTSYGKNIRFNKGEILVSIHSSPILMHLIRKCSAMVTDEGGIACHAAIVSRELKIPCVMATKHATSSIHDGDRIEVNATSGLIKIIRCCHKSGGSNRRHTVHGCG